MLAQPFAWTISDQILHSSSSREALYFSANTIRSKIKHSFLELPQDSHEPLKQSLIEHLQRFNAGPTEVFVQVRWGRSCDPR